MKFDKDMMALFKAMKKASRPPADIIVQRLGLDEALQPALEALAPVERSLPPVQLSPLTEGPGDASSRPETEPEPVASGRP